MVSTVSVARRVIRGSRRIRSRSRTGTPVTRRIGSRHWWGRKVTPEPTEPTAPRETRVIRVTVARKEIPAKKDAKARRAKQAAKAIRAKRAKTGQMGMKVRKGPKAQGARKVTTGPTVLKDPKGRRVQKAIRARTARTGQTVTHGYPTPHLRRTGRWSSPTTATTCSRTLPIW